MRAILYGMTVLEPNVKKPTGLELVSATQLGSGSVAMVWNFLPLPAICMRGASCMMAEASMALVMISLLTSGSKITLVVWREMS